MAKKLTPEEAISEIRRGLIKCYESAFVMRLSKSYLLSHGAKIDSSREKILEVITAALNDLNILAGTNPTPAFWDTILCVLEDLEVCTDNFISVVASQVHEYDYTSGDPAEAEKFSAKTTPLFQRIKEEIKILRAICKQFTK